MRSFSYSEWTPEARIRFHSLRASFFVSPSTEETVATQLGRIGLTFRRDPPCQSACFTKNKTHPKNKPFFKARKEACCFRTSHTRPAPTRRQTLNTSRFATFPPLVRTHLATLRQHRDAFQDEPAPTCTRHLPPSHQQTQRHKPAHHLHRHFANTNRQPGRSVKEKINRKIHAPGHHFSPLKT